MPGLYAAGDLACVPHNYMIGAFVFGDLAATQAASRFVDVAPPHSNFRTFNYVKRTS